MQLIDWLVVIGYCIIITLVGLAFKKKAEGSVDDFFLSGRKLPWWLAGTSLVATSFASDTPLFVTGLVRTNGIAGNWHWWFMAFASVASLFFFARLWRRARVVTDMELIELRYGPGPGAILRGVKAVFLGLILNIYIIGAWPWLGLTKVMEVSTDWQKTTAVVFCGFLALSYAVFSGLWGVVATDFIQFIFALGGAILLSAFALNKIGGFEGFWEKLNTLPQVDFIAPHTPEAFWESPFILFLSFILVQWWARGVEGDGIAVQRLAACKNEKHAFFAMLWYNIAHYAIRPWPWIAVGLCSLVILPEVINSSGAVDHELAYPRMIVELMPAGLRGLMIAAFFAAFMSTVDTHLNWGSSYIVNDVYRRFVKKEASPKHYVWIGRIITVVLLVGGMIIALTTSSIVEAFYNVMLLFSGMGLVGLARWFWWRINAWSEISAMLASGIFTLFSSNIAVFFGWPDTRTIHLFIVISFSTAIWVIITFLTKPIPESTLTTFYERIKPSGPGWKPIAKNCPGVKSPDSIAQNSWGWVMGLFLILGSTIGIGKLLLGQWLEATVAGVFAICGLIGIKLILNKMNWKET